MATGRSHRGRASHDDYFRASYDNDFVDNDYVRTGHDDHHFRAAHDDEHHVDPDDSHLHHIIHGRIHIQHLHHGGFARLHDDQHPAAADLWRRRDQSAQRAMRRARRQRLPRRLPWRLYVPTTHDDDFRTGHHDDFRTVDDDDFRAGHDHYVRTGHNNYFPAAHNDDHFGTTDDDHHHHRDPGDDYFHHNVHGRIGIHLHHVIQHLDPYGPAHVHHEQHHVPAELRRRRGESGKRTVRRQRRLYLPGRLPRRLHVRSDRDPRHYRG